MLWKVRASLDDRPGAMAALAASCGEQSVNILGLQIFPAPDGRVVDELVLHTPGGWDAVAVQQLCLLAGVEDAAVATCGPQTLEDQAVRYVRAAQVVLEEPGLLEEQLCRLLDAFPADGLPGLDALVLDDAHGPLVVLSRTVPFTDTEIARARELRRLAASALGHGPDPRLRPAPDSAPVPPRAVTLRRGSMADAGALVAMHARSSAETVYRRYHAPVQHVTARLARALLEPVGGLSMVLATGDDVVAVGMVGSVGRDDDGDQVAEVGLMVEDRWQRQGHGSQLLRALAFEAARAGIDTLLCTVLPDSTALLSVIRRAGLRARVCYDDGLTQYRVPVARLVAPDEVRPRRGNRPAMGEVTAPLVALLHERRELREIYPPADLIDQAVRGGA